ncbi:MAG: sugar phosphate isomerase/epimerase family protein [Chthoniobacteraceae bacterium]
MRFGICNEIFGEWPIDEALQYAAKTGYDFLEIAPFTLASSVNEISATERQRIRDAAAKAGIGISGLHWVLVKTEGLHLTTPDAGVRQRTSRYFVDLVDCAADLGGNRIILGSPKQRNVEEGVTYEQAWDWATQTLRDATKRAEDRGVVICFEPLGPVETNFVNTAEEGIRFAEQFASPAMSVIIDVKAMSTEAKPIAQVIRESAGKFSYFHANDPNLKGPGFGEVDFRPIGEALHDVGYDGIVSVEVFDFTEGPEVIATQSLANLKAAFAR